MATLPEVTYTAQHTRVFDAALRDARTQLPSTADAQRADRGVVLALNGHVTLYSPTEAHVTSGSDAEVVYRVSRWSCDCPDGTRRLAQRPDVAPGVRGCKHWYAAVLTAMAHLNLAIKGYQPEALGEEWYPAVSLEEQWYGFSGSATEVESGLWWFCFSDWSGGFYTDETSLELYNREPEHLIAWCEAVRSWERWLAGGR